MCGIAGILSGDPRGLDARIALMNRAQRHRGPDADGRVCVQAGAHWLALGHTRLAIQDLSIAGAQPMRLEPGGNLLVFNGEIYNAPVLRQELQARGAVFRGHSDTEVLLQALMHWGETALNRLRGMYAFAWYNETAGRLFLARDPVGIKPLYYSQVGDQFLFSSEVRALIASGLVNADIDQRALSGLLAYGAVQEPLAIIRGVRSLPPGHLLRVDARPAGRGGASLRLSEPQAHWRLPSPDSTISSDQAIETVRLGVERAVHSHLLADVPVGVFLSAGLDSTLVASIAARHSRDVRSFTVGFQDDEDHDEAGQAEATARMLGIEHRTLRLRQEDARGEVIPWLDSQDQPGLDGLNVYVISRAVRGQGIKVALSGQGGDEIFGGYPSFSDVPRLLRAMRYARALPIGAKLALADVLSLGRAQEFREKLRDLVSVGADLVALALQRRRCLSNEQMTSLGFPDPSSLGQRGFFPCESLADLPVEPSDPVHAVSLAEVRGYLGGTLLHVGDVAGMAHGLEIRVPFLDTGLLEDVLTIPGSVRLPSGRADKFLLRRAFPNLLRSELLTRRKTGFVLPLKRWMRGMLREPCEAAIASLKSSGLVEESGVDRVWTSFVWEPEGVAWSRAWLLVALGHWLKGLKVSSPIRAIGDY